MRRQTTFCVPLEVKPASCSRLSALLSAFRLRVEQSESDYDLIAREVPSLHFMSMSVFPHEEYDPMFVLEANFDGPSGVFWGQLSAVFGEELRAMLRCCKRPLDRDGPLYDAVTANGSKASVAPYLEARTQRPSVFHHGNRGLTRDRVLEDEQLFRTVREEIDGTAGASPYRGLPAEHARQKLRTALLPRFSWLEQRAPQRIPFTEGFADIARLAAFAVVLLLVLSTPGLILAPLLGTGTYLAIVAVATVAVAAMLMRPAANRTDRPARSVSTRLQLRPTRLLVALLVLAGYVLIAAAISALLVVCGSYVLAWFTGAAPISFADAFSPMARTIALGLLAAPFVLGLILLRVRHLEQRDSTREAPEIEARTLREIVRREDWIAQNHMGSIVLIKPGVLRTIIIRAGHLGLGLVLRVTARNGYLGSMRTVHFAHWAFLNNSSRLLFLSNFDHSWGSYLDDFIEKAATGLTLAWGCGVGFPPTRFLVGEGAAHGRLFKNWALASRSVSRFWYSAYRHLTVDQIERNHRIANGLRARRLSEAQARTWMMDL